MGHIKEPKGINLTVDPTPLTAKDKARISEVISYYKATGKKLRAQKSKSESRTGKKIKVKS